MEVVKVAASAELRGTFVLSYAGDATDTLPFDATEAAVEAALEALPSLRTVQVENKHNPPRPRGSLSLSLFRTQPPSLSL